MKSPTLRDRLRYKSDQFFQSGFTLQLVVAAVVLTVVVSMFFIIAEILGVQPGTDFDVESGSADPFWPSTRFWWVVTHVLESYWIERATLPQVMSLMMTMFNLIVFAALVGLFGSRVQQKLEQVRRGTTRVIEEDHIVILGWSGKVLPVMKELLEGFEGARPTFVLHTEYSIDDIDERIKRAISRRQARWVIRQGSLTDMSDLQLLNVHRARTVVILSGGGDAQAVKSIMAVAHLVQQAAEQQSSPMIVAELNRKSMRRLAYTAAGDVAISLVQPAEHLSRIILQTARQQGLVHVYEEILSHFGNELHFTAATPLAGLPWHATVRAFPHAVPIGVLREGTPVLAPRAGDANFSINASDVMICLARSEEAMKIRTGSAIPELPQAAPVAFEAHSGVRSLLLLGWNEKSLPLLEEYLRYASTLKSSFTATVVSSAVPEWFSEVEFGEHDTGLLSLEVHREDALGEGVLERVRPETYDAIIILGEAGRRDGNEDADTKVIMLLLLLRSMRESAALRGAPFPERQQIVSEILDPANKALAESTGASKDVIISNALVSKMIAQICRDKRTELVIRDFFDEEGMEIYLKPSVWYADEGMNMNFEELQLAVTALGDILIGIENSEPTGTSIEINPGRDRKLAVGTALRLVVISEHEGVGRSTTF
jgi:ion channel POLLUX/CASTOR